MPSRQTRRDRGAYRADQLLHRTARDLRDARLAAGLSLDAVAGAAGMSASQVNRIEHARIEGVSVRTLAILHAVLGMRLTVRGYPDGDPLRDAGQARLITRWLPELHPSLEFRAEVSIGLPGDLRAWDGEILAPDGTCKLEAETVLYDLQAQERRLTLKMADAGVDLVILLVADTRHNRAVLREHRASLAARFPLDTRAVMRALRAGRLPAASGIVLW